MRDWLRRAAWRLRALFGGARIDHELDEELRLHIELEARDLARMRGLATDEARRQALVAFGGVERFKEEHRDARGVRWIEEVARDARYAVRALRRSPAYALSTILVLALGIGASTAVFSAVDAVLLSRLPYPADDRLVRVYLSNSPALRIGLSAVDFRAIEAQARSLSAFGIARRGDVALAFGREPERAAAGFATAGFFRALGLPAARGRLLLPADESPGAAPVAVIGHSLALRAFGSDAAALGRTVTVDGEAHTVVGVLAPGVRDLAGYHAELWPALRLRPPTRRGPFGLLALGRLADGVTLAAGQRELATISRRIYPDWAQSFQDSTMRFVAVPLREAMLGRAGSTIALFVAAVALVLLITVANVASLTLVRAMGRRREVALRASLGATRARLARLLVTESLALALAGAALGLALGAAGLRVLQIMGTELPRLDGARLDLRAVAFAVGIALVAGAVVGASPVMLLLRGDASRALGDGSRTASAGRGSHALRGAFVVAQFALALPLLAGAGLLLNSFLRLQRVDPGFDPAHLLAATVSLPSGRYPDDTTVRDFWARALPRVREIPGVVALGLGTALPPDDGNVCCNNFDLIDHPVPPGGSQPASPWIMASSDYFAAIGARLDEGRLFTPADTGAAPVVVVSRAWARHYFPEGNVIGRQLISGGCITCPRTTVVGVVGDVKYTGLGGGADAVYSPVGEGWSSARSVVLVVRTAGPPRDAVAGVRAALRSVDPGLPLDDIAPMPDRLASSIDAPRQLTSFVGGFALAAMALAAVGIFGMLSYAVSARRREIGVRMALGARRGEVVRLVVRGGMAHAAAGALIGLAITLLLARRLAGALFQVGPTDPATLAGVTLLLLAVALVASWIPARRAAAIDPVETIRDS